jgi:UDP-N-acetylmuramoyl-tripeptide--D-alanyl-D-alanine ligase
MERFTLSDAALMMNAALSSGADGSTVVQEICTDSRQAKEGSLFFALKGENSDGYVFAEGALRAGAAAVVVDRPVERIAGAQIVVPNALKALGELAREYRKRFTIPVIGLTGSVGKTSTRDMLAVALRARLNVLTSEKNFNNEIGLPLTLLRMDRSHEAAVVEMGMRGAGQIAELCEIARPDIGLITNIGMSHIELLGSREAVARAKGE